MQRSMPPEASISPISCSISLSQPMRETLDIIGAAQGVGHLRDACLIADDLLGSKTDQGRFLGREGVSFVVTEDACRLRPGKDNPQHVYRRSDDVVQGLPLRRLRAEEPQKRRSIIDLGFFALNLSLAIFAHNLRAARIFGDLLEEIQPHDEVKSKPGSEIVEGYARLTTSST